MPHGDSHKTAPMATTLSGSINKIGEDRRTPETYTYTNSKIAAAKGKIAADQAA